MVHFAVQCFARPKNVVKSIKGVNDAALAPKNNFLNFMYHD